MKLTPYRQVAKRALMSWNGLSEEDATNAVLSQSFDELEGNCGASGSMQYAIDHLAKVLGFNDEQKKEFADAVFAKDHAEVDAYDQMQFDRARKRLEASFGRFDKFDSQVRKGVNEMILDTLSAIHDGWVRDNAKKFNKEGRENKRYQHLPLELIGWKEAKADLLFLQPILEAVGIDENLSKNFCDNNIFLSVAYKHRVERFFNDNELRSKDDVKDYILNIDKHYDKVSELNSTKDPQIAEQMVDQVVDRLPDMKNNKVKTETEDR